MKLAGARALAWCEKPPANPRVALIFGGDSGLVSASADELAKHWAPGADPLNIVRMNDDDLKRDPQKLADELVARSLLGGARVVRLRIDRETSAKLPLEILGDIDSGLLLAEAAWIVEAGDLGRNSKLRAGFEAAEKAVALQLYADDESTVAELVSKRLGAAGVAIEPDAMALFVSELPGDRRLAMAEMEKLELYALDLGRAVTREDIAILSAAEQERGADDVADAAILGDAGAALAAADRLLGQGGSAISAMRTLHFRLLRVADAVASNSPNGARLRPPVFDKEWPRFSRALRDWPPAKLQRAFTQLYEAEKACKQAGSPAEVILSALIQRIATRNV